MFAAAIAVGNTRRVLRLLAKANTPQRFNLTVAKLSRHIFTLSFLGISAIYIRHIRSFWRICIGKSQAITNFKLKSEKI